MSLKFKFKFCNCHDLIREKHAHAYITMVGGLSKECIPQQLRYLQPDSIVAYTDGSCLGNRHCAVNNYIAGWGAVLLQGSSGTIENPADHGALIIRHGKIWGPVVTDPQSEHFMGAKYGSNNTGEVCAIGEVLK